MQFFKRILKQPDLAVTEVAREERRSDRRHAINPDFPLQSVLSFIGRDETGAQLSSQRGGWNWKGRLVDFSELGARMRLAPSVLAASGDFCDLKLRLEGFALVVPCRITNMRVQQEGVFFGLKHEITDESTHRAYRQLLEIVALGAALKPEFKKPRPDDSGYLLERYASDLPSRLSVWRHQTGQAVTAFEFLLKDCLVRAAEGHRMEYLAGADAAASRPASPTKATEIHRLFHWVVSNIAPTVPADVRKFLQGYAAT